MSDFVLPLHLLILSFAAWNILRADHLGYLWFSGRLSLINAEDIRKYHLRVFASLLGMIGTGLLLFFPMREFLLSRPQFYLKMAFVLALFLNALAIERMKTVATKKEYKDLSFQERLPLLVSGGISLLCWVGAGTTAFFLIPD